MMRSAPRFSTITLLCALTVVPLNVLPSVSYELMQLGRSFAAQVAALVEWSRDSKHQIELAQESFDARQGA